MREQLFSDLVEYVAHMLKVQVCVLCTFEFIYLTSAYTEISKKKMLSFKSNWPRYRKLLCSIYAFFCRREYIICTKTESERFRNQKQDVFLLCAIPEWLRYSSRNAHGISLGFHTCKGKCLFERQEFSFQSEN